MCIALPNNVDTSTPINVTQEPVEETKDKFNIFDEQGTGQLRTLSEPESHKENDKVSEKQKTFDSRKTSVQRPVEQLNSPGKHGESNTETRDEEKALNETPRTHPSLTDRSKRKYNDISDLALFTLKDWKESQIYKYYTTASKQQRADFIEYLLETAKANSGKALYPHII